MRFVFRLVALFLLVAAAITAAFAWWANRPLDLPGEAVEFRVAPGSSLHGTIQQINAAGIPLQADLFKLLARWQGKVNAIKAGSYATESGETPYTLLVKLVEGRVSQASVTLVEGWTFRQFRARLDAHPALRHDSRTLDEAAISARLGLPWRQLEGRLLPDTYLFDKESSDLEVIARAAAAMQKELGAAWAARPGGLPYRSPDEALIMASIIEKETGRPEDRPHVAAVFINRLRQGMRLQTDPTVIYGLGENFDGNLRKSHLQTDTPYNTYTRAGLPPTPIAMPGPASLRAAFQPAASDALYFVARGDGSSHFSRTLDEHNRAVNRYQRGGK